jgi:hypothetical protein
LAQKYLGVSRREAPRYEKSGFRQPPCVRQCEWRNHDVTRFAEAQCYRRKTVLHCTSSQQSSDGHIYGRKVSEHKVFKVFGWHTFLRRLTVRREQGTSQNSKTRVLSAFSSSAIAQFCCIAARKPFASINSRLSWSWMASLPSSRWPRGLSAVTCPTPTGLRRCRK